MTLWTIGHSNRSIAVFLNLLRENGVHTLVDVRTLPRSRHNPQFNFDDLARVLQAGGVNYRHEARLGGLRAPRPDSRNSAFREAGIRGFADHMETSAFDEALRDLCSLAEGGGTAILCAEARPERCHRSLISDALVARGVRVRHILGESDIEDHRLTQFARIERGRITYEGDQRDLFPSKER